MWGGASGISALTATHSLDVPQVTSREENGVDDGLSDRLPQSSLAISIMVYMTMRRRLGCRDKHGDPCDLNREALRTGKPGEAWEGFGARGILIV